jgi:outer membrane protein OmpA-like peptidoglycan-associated protein
MTRRQGWGLSVVLAGTLAACATPPKPRELEAYETIRRNANLIEVKKRSPDLVDQSERRGNKATEEWQSNDLEDSRKDALLAQIKLKTAIALHEQDQLKAKIQMLSGQEAQAEEEYAGLAKDLASENEKVALAQKYVEARKAAAAEKERLSQQMSSAEAEQNKLKQQLASEQKIAEALLAIRTAETVDASKYAKGDYASAIELLAKAEADLKKSDFAGAQANAGEAKKSADRALEAAKPMYEQAEQASQNKERNDALSRDASAISGVNVKFEKRGDLQRLVLVVPQMFEKRQPNVAPGREGVLDQLAALIKKYPSYPVQVIGYTDNKGKAGELMAVSAARAQNVFSALVSRGVESKRLMVSGLGGEEPFVDNKSAAGRAKNNRIEIVFLYH